MPEKNINFFSRNDCSLDGIEYALQASIHQVAGVVLSGLPGAGKTQTAIEFAHAYVKKYDLVLWLKASGNNLATEFKQLFSALLETADLLKKDKISNNSTEDVIEIVYRVLHSHFKKILYVFDNADDYSSIAKYLPHNTINQQNILHCLITSRNNSGWLQWALVKKLSFFSSDEAEAFLTKGLDNHNEFNKVQHIKTLAKLLGGFPLAMAQALAYIKQGPFPMRIADFIKQYQECSENLLTTNYLPVDQYEHSVRVIWIQLKQKLQMTCPLAIELAELSSYLYPDQIALSLFASYSRQELLSAAKQLSNYSIIVPLINNESFRIHRLLQAAIRLDNKEVKIRLLQLLAYLRSSIKNFLRSFAVQTTNHAIALTIKNHNEILHAKYIFSYATKDQLQDIALTDLAYRLIYFTFFDWDIKLFKQYLNYLKYSCERFCCTEPILTQINDAIERVSSIKIFQTEKNRIEDFILDFRCKSMNNDSSEMRQDMGNTEQKNIQIRSDQIEILLESQGEKDLNGQNLRAQRIKIICQGGSHLRFTDVNIRCEELTIFIREDASLKFMNVDVKSTRAEISSENGSFNLVFSKMNSERLKIYLLNSNFTIGNSCSITNVIDIRLDSSCTFDAMGFFIKSDVVNIHCASQSLIRLSSVFIRSDVVNQNFNNDFTNFISGLYVHCDVFNNVMKNAFFSNILLITEVINIKGHLYMLLDQKSFLLSDTANFEQITLSSSSLIFIKESELNIFTQNLVNTNGQMLNKSMKKAEKGAFVNFGYDIDQTLDTDMYSTFLIVAGSTTIDYLNISEHTVNSMADNQFAEYASFMHEDFVETSANDKDDFIRALLGGSFFAKKPEESVAKEDIASQFSQQ